MTNKFEKFDVIYVVCAFKYAHKYVLPLMVHFLIAQANTTLNENFGYPNFTSSTVFSLATFIFSSDHPKLCKMGTQESSVDTKY